MSMLFWELTGGSFLPGTVTDIAKYEKALEYADWIHRQDMTEHFPRTIPDNAKNIRFSHHQGGLQASFYLQLRMTLPIEEVKRIHAKYKEVATHRFTGGNPFV